MVAPGACRGCVVARGALFAHGSRLNSLYMSVKARIVAHYRRARRSLEERKYDRDVYTEKTRYSRTTRRRFYLYMPASMTQERRRSRIGLVNRKGALFAHGSRRNSLYMPEKRLIGAKARTPWRQARYPRTKPRHSRTGKSYTLFRPRARLRVSKSNDKE